MPNRTVDRTSWLIFKPTIMAGLLALFSVSSWGVAETKSGGGNSALNWPTLGSETKPWAYWWWMGNAVDTNNITALLESYQKAGYGGMHIVPIYGVRGEEKRFVDFLSPQWMNLLAHTVSEGKRLGFGVDMTCGTGWNFGGPQVSPADAPTKVVGKIFPLSAGQTLTNVLQLKDEVDGRPLKPIALMAYSSGEARDISGQLDADGKLNWKPESGDWKVCALWESKIKGAVVERASPGGQGHMANPFSHRALTNYLARFDQAFQTVPSTMVRAFYHDSYEYHGSTWCDDFLEQFKRRRGYDLRTQLPAFLGDGMPEDVGRVRCDYRETIADLHLEEYIQPWTEWARRHGAITRNQAHGSPSSLLDTYAAADIPEIEVFGATGFDIPGLPSPRKLHERPNRDVMLRFASSAAHVGGRKFVASETCTWLDEHFKETLALVKPELDQLFVNGINQIVYHGVSYSPTNAEWPGWLFYASTHFGPSGTIWRDLPAANLYAARCQAVLQSGAPDSDVLLYYPNYDLWQRPKGLNERFGDFVQPTQVHYVGNWLLNTPFDRAQTALSASGRRSDYVSDRFLQKAEVANGQIKLGAQSYPALVVPECQFMPAATLARMLDLAEAGATVIFHKATPASVPGFGRRAERQKELEGSVARLNWESGGTAGIQSARIGRGRVVKGENLPALLDLAGIRREPITETGVDFIRRRHEGGHHYFVTSLGNYRVDGWVKLGVAARSAVVMDPMTGKTGVAALDSSEKTSPRVCLQLEPGQSLILRTFESENVKGPRWKYLQPSGEPVEIAGDWQVTFVDGGPVLPQSVSTNRLVSWTEFPDEEAKRFAGTARYTIRFNLPQTKADDWQLDVGRVCETARIKVNGQDAGTLFSFPFHTRIGELLKPGVNELEIEVTNLGANRVRDLDRRKVPWKKFYDINYVSIKYGPFDAANWPLTDSGLFGPVRLLPLQITGGAVR